MARSQHPVLFKAEPQKRLRHLLLLCRGRHLCHRNVVGAAVTEINRDILARADIDPTLLIDDFAVFHPARLDGVDEVLVWRQSRRVKHTLSFQVCAVAALSNHTWAPAVGTSTVTLANCCTATAA